MSITGVYQIDTQKVMGGEYWTNRYHVEAGSFQEALAAGEEIAAAERQQSINLVTFVSVRASTPDAGDNAFIVAPLGYSGAITAAGFPLPLFVVVRCVFQKGPGRPDVKYMKGFANPDALQDSFNYKDTVVTGINNGYLASVFAVEGLCDADGTAYTSASVDKRVGMRQLRRGSKRRTTPIIPLGEPDLSTASLIARRSVGRAVQDARPSQSEGNSPESSIQPTDVGDSPERRMVRR